MLTQVASRRPLLTGATLQPISSRSAVAHNLCGLASFKAETANVSSTPSSTWAIHEQPTIQTRQTNFDSNKLRIYGICSELALAGQREMFTQWCK